MKKLYAFLYSCSLILLFLAIPHQSLSASDEPDMMTRSILRHVLPPKDSKADTPVFPRDVSFLTAALEFSEDYQKAVTANTTFIALSKQPEITKLLNLFDTDGKESFYNWFRKRDTRWARYKEGRKKWEDEKRITQKSHDAIVPLLEPEPSEVKTPTEVAFEEVKAELLEQYRSLTLTDLEHLIYTTKNRNTHYRREGLTRQRVYRFPAYQNPPESLTDAHRVKSSLLSPSELPIELHKLIGPHKNDGLIARLGREVFVLNKILLIYHRDFIEKIKGWTAEQFGNWWVLTQLIKDTQDQIEKEVSEELAPLQSLSTPRTKVLAQLRFRLFWAKVKKQKEAYNAGLRVEGVDAAYDLLPRFTEETEKAPKGFKEIYEGNGTIFPAELSPHRSLFLAVLKEYPRKRKVTTPIEFVDYAKDETREAVKKRVNQIRTPPTHDEAVTRWVYDPTFMREYPVAIRLYHDLLREQQKLHLKLHVSPTNTWFKSCVPESWRTPEPWRLFFRDSPKETPPIKEIDLSNAGLTDAHFEIPAGASQKERTFGSLQAYTTVILVGNKGLIGALDYRLNIWLQKLDMSGCGLRTLKGLLGLKLVRYLDVSNNQLSNSADCDLSPLADFINLTFLNLSKNKVSKLLPVISLKNLGELNVSETNVDTLASLTLPKLRILRAAGTPIKGWWRDVLSSNLKRLEVLDLTNVNLMTGSQFHPGEFRDKYPILKSLKLKDGNEFKFTDEAENLEDSSD